MSFLEKSVYILFFLEMSIFLSKILSILLLFFLNYIWHHGNDCRHENIVWNYLEDSSLNPGNHFVTKSDGTKLQFLEISTVKTIACRTSHW